ncbi:hypothetical protein TanjilG_27086 [Lupinus angustifolius]|uniref:Transmembrane protein n=1 Tax=Lupinus angustifolius TaxID=3871 RepID=A0A4P1QVW5_LUPAN|nr:PREDICTED: uncharacterized protein LOC109328879 [Lupinus angustifolius]OIV95982.1 hypothetical protein TanjilG_27086 [Lupinus angustifolius]
MPFPWKKNKVTTFSQIVADLHSPKRRVSLVVETGFPTSLIDLFVKNRTRFRKTKSNKPVQPHHEFTDSPPPPPPPPPPSPATTPHHHMNQTVIVNGDEDGISGKVGECEFGSGLNIGVAVLVKMVVVLVLVASVERLTVAFTVSAFALVFFEYAGERVVSPFSNAKIESLSKRVSDYVSVSVSDCVCWFQKVLELKFEKGNSEVGSVELGSIDEIEVVESKSEVGIFCEEGFFVDENESSNKVIESCGISECKSKGSSRSGRFKSKIVKKLLGKKFLRSKKEKEVEKITKEEFEVESISEVSSVIDEHKLDSFEIEEEEEENSSLLIGTKLECVRDNGDEVNCGITYSQKSLLIIALMGLVMGRFQALVLTITWCVILKFVKILWRSKNVPIIKCSVPKS